MEAIIGNCIKIMRIKKCLKECNVFINSKLMLVLLFWIGSVNDRKAPVWEIIAVNKDLIIRRK